MTIVHNVANYEHKESIVFIDELVPGLLIKMPANRQRSDIPEWLTLNRIRYVTQHETGIMYGAILIVGDFTFDTTVYVSAGQTLVVRATDDMPVECTVNPADLVVDKDIFLNE